ncbi:Rad9-domain-containing protein, partial [Chytriomyces sp. MP71]
MRIEFGHAVAKGFARCIATLARIGDDLYIEMQPNGVMLLYTVNLARTAFAKVALLASFFDAFELDSTRHFKVLVKTMTGIFKSRNSDLIEKVVFKIVQNDELNRLVVELQCKHGVKKIFHLHYQSTEPLKASFSKEACTSSFSASPKIVQDWLTYFSLRLEEVSLAYAGGDDEAGSNSKKVVNFKSFTEDALVGAFPSQASQTEFDPTKRSLSTEISVDIDDFDTFDVYDNVEITFSLKDLKTTLSFADSINQCISAHFIGPGQPIIFSTNQENIYSADFVLATNSFIGGSQTQPRSNRPAGIAQAPALSQRPSQRPSQNPSLTSQPAFSARSNPPAQASAYHSNVTIRQPSQNAPNRPAGPLAKPTPPDEDDDMPLFSQPSSEQETQPPLPTVILPTSDSKRRRMSDHQHDPPYRRTVVEDSRSPSAGAAGSSSSYRSSINIPASTLPPPDWPHSRPNSGTSFVPGTRASSGRSAAKAAFHQSDEDDDDDDEEIPLDKPVRRQRVPEPAAANSSRDGSFMMAS